MKHYAIIIVLLILGGCQAKQKKDTPLPPSTPIYMQIAQSELARNPDPRYLDFRTAPKWEYTNGLVCLAMFQVWERTHQDQYLDYVKFYADSMINEDGSIKTYSMKDYNIDRINSGKVLFELLRVDNQPKYRKAIDTLREQMRHHPRTSEGGFWHKKRYQHQMWLDGLYMGAPFLAQYAQVYHEDSLFDDVTNQILLVDSHTWNPEKQLYHHGWDESRKQKWADPQTGVSPNFWGRAEGWFAMATVDVLDYLPKDHPKRKQVISIVNKLAAGILKYQDEASGVWWQVLDQGGRDGNYLEASCSSMFTYFLAKSINKGYIDSSYESARDKAYKGLIETFINYNDDGSVNLTDVCAVAGLGGNPFRDASYKYYVNEPRRDNDPKGIGPFIMASLLMEKDSAKTY